MQIKFSKRSQVIKALLISLAFLLVACGRLVPAPLKDDFHTHLALGRILYDSGDIEGALYHAKKANELDPNSEEAATILGFVYLSLAGGDVVTILTKLKAADSSGKSKDVNQLSSIKSALGFTDEEFALLGSVNTDVEDLPVIEPKCADHARELIQRLGFVNAAIQAICPFVDPDLHLEDETRHNCVSNLQSSRGTSSHLLWALSHLVEALAFHAVITYATTDAGKTNLELRVAKVQDFDLKDPSKIGSFIIEVGSLANLIQKIIPISERCSDAYAQTQMVALINDLVSTSLAFKKIKGIPTEFTESVVASIKKIEDIRQKAQEGVEGAGEKKAQVENLKGDLTRQMSEVIAQKIDSIDVDSYSVEQKEELCSSFKEISGSVDTRELPDLCQGT